MEILELGSFCEGFLLSKGGDLEAEILCLVEHTNWGYLEMQS